jgi:hypothetical protein
MKIINNILDFYRNFFLKKQSNELSEKNLDLFILSILEEIKSNDKNVNENFDGIQFIHNFDSKLKDKVKVNLKELVENKLTNELTIEEGYLKIREICRIVQAEFDRINEKLSIEELRRKIIDCGQDIDLKFEFYYDETNNPRKFWIKENKFNSPVNKNFVLGGIVVENSEFIKNLGELKNRLKLPNNIKEIKSNLILKSNFIESLKSKNLNEILKWMSKNEVYIHFINIDNLYLIVKGILEIIIDKNLNESEIIALELLYGSILYKIMSININKVCDLLSKYNYPKIEKKDLIKFCEDWVILLKYLKTQLPPPEDELESLGRKIMFDELWGLFEKVKDIDNFTGIGEGKYIVKDYSDYYLSKPILFSNSFHIFDQELEIEKIINTNPDVNFDGNKNFIFKNSIEEEIIQICDTIVGLLSRFFAYIEELNSGNLENEKIVEELHKSLFKLNSNQKENFLLFINLLKKSQAKNKLFFDSEVTFVQKNNLDFILCINDITEKLVNYRNKN